MYVKNINQLFKEQLPLNLRFSNGTTIYGKIISQEGKNALIQLYDGTIIPSIFLSENKLVNNKFIKFAVKGFNNNRLLLKIIDDTIDSHEPSSLDTLIKKLNIPQEEGTKIINSLVKFNLPATDENIMNIYKKISFFSNLGKMNDHGILTFMEKYIKGNFTEESKEFSIAKEIISRIQKIDIDFLSFLKENDIPSDLENILKSYDFVSNKFGVNNILGILKNSTEEGNSQTYIFSLDDIIKEIKDKPEIINLLPDSLKNNFAENIDVLNHLNNNYNIYYFNSYINNKIFKNNIIIRNKYNSKSSMDSGDVKVFITLETPNIGIVEAYLYKRYENLTINIKTENSYIDMFKGNIELLNKALTEKGYNIIDISIESIDTQANIVSLCDFFSDVAFKELDVRV